MRLHERLERDLFERISRDPLYRFSIDLTFELGRRKRAAWGAFKSIEDVVKRTRNIRLRAHLLNITFLPALTYASETWAFRKPEENAISVKERGTERVMLAVTRFTEVKERIRSSLLRRRSKIRVAAAYAKESKIRWAGRDTFQRQSLDQSR
ncbi:hypothetical protein RB195_018690 [Necator americanus]|uniref:Uncharacterized protein n=1 Tax=Necator americanus TaxID=51031 RepID=A0ABR1CAW8_NECAM